MFQPHGPAEGLCAQAGCKPCWSDSVDSRQTLLAGEQEACTDEGSTAGKHSERGLFPENLNLYVPQEQVVKQAFGNAFPLSTARYPVAIVDISVLPKALDLNLEPNKTSVLLHDLVSF